MPEPVVDLLASEWDVLVRLGDSFAPQEWDQPTELPGWSVKDLYSHIIGTERAMRGETPPAVEGAAEAPHVRNPIAAMNEAWVAARRGVPGPDVLAEFETVTTERAAELRALPPERFDEVGWTPVGQAPFRVFLAVRVFDCWVHEQDARRVLGRPGHLEGAVPEHCVERLVSSYPFVLGKRLAADEGTTLVVTITGPAGRTSAVGMEGGRAHFLQSVPAAPTATITLDTEAALVLGTGRWTADDPRLQGRVVLGGDEALARRFVEHLNTMI